MYALVPARMELIFAVDRRAWLGLGGCFMLPDLISRGGGRGPFTVTECGTVRYSWVPWHRGRCWHVNHSTSVHFAIDILAVCHSSFSFFITVSIKLFLFQPMFFTFHASNSPLHPTSGDSLWLGVFWLEH